MFEVIPAIDILNGKAVRLTKGDYNLVTVYHDYPEEMARSFELAGASTIHLVDLDGARVGQPINLQTIEKIRLAVRCRLELGGGLRTAEDVARVLDLGIERVILGSVALKNRKLTEELVKKYGRRIVIGIDARDGFVATEGWLESSTVTVEALAKEMQDIGVETIIYTDISRDGMLSGPNLEAYKAIVKKTSMAVIASGGISGLKDIRALQAISGMAGVVVGKAIYEKKFKLEELFHA